MPAAVPAGRRVYVVGDIHGRDDLLRRMHRLIAADATTAAAGTDKVLIYLGDYVDRGPATADVLDRLLYGRLPGFRAVHLKGNHEDMMQDFLAGRTSIAWLANGGAATCESYGVTVGSARLDAIVLNTLRHRLAAALPAEHQDFLAGLALWHREGDYVFVHAGVRPGVPLRRQQPRDLLWIREPFLIAGDAIGRTVVHGHTIVDWPEVLPWRIGIDTGAFFSDRLTCLVLEGDERRFLHT